MESAVLKNQLPDPPGFKPEPSIDPDYFEGPEESVSLSASLEESIVEPEAHGLGPFETAGGPDIPATVPEVGPFEVGDVAPYVLGEPETWTPTYELGILKEGVGARALEEGGSVIVSGVSEGTGGWGSALVS